MGKEPNGSEWVDTLDSHTYLQANIIKHRKH